MNAQDYRKAVLQFSNGELVSEYFSLRDKLAYELVSLGWGEYARNQYWNYDRPEYQAQLKVVEIELSYRHINL